VGTDNELVPAYVPTPGEILLMELVARGWTMDEFAEIVGDAAPAISQIVNAQKQITPEFAQCIANALDTSAELWNNLESDYGLYVSCS
jgi:addiction module HigA family antidote